MGIKYTTAESTRFRLDADCYGHAGEGYLKRGEFLTVPEGTPISQTWTEVDENGEEVEGGHKSRKISRVIERPKGSMKTLVEGAESEDDEADAEATEAAPTPPAAGAKPKKATGAKPAKAR